MRRPGALLLNWLDLEDGAGPDFECWHNREHVAERLALPGFLRCRRYSSIEDRPAPGHALLIVYEARDTGVFASDAYAASLNAPTPLTQTLVPKLRRVTRAILAIEQDFGYGLGCWLATATMSSAAALQTWPLDAAAVLRVPSVTGMTVSTRPQAAADAKTGSVEERATDRDPSGIAACILIASSRPEGLDDAIGALGATPGLGLQPFHRFQLAFAADA